MGASWYTDGWDVLETNRSGDEMIWGRICRGKSLGDELNIKRLNEGPLQLEFKTLTKGNCLSHAPMNRYISTYHPHVSPNLRNYKYVIYLHTFS